MKRLLSTESLADLGHYRNLLEQAGIACIIKNDQLSGALGEIPFLECLPELWIVDDAAFEAAQRLLADASGTEPRQAAWRCTRCGEFNEAQFGVCWQCGEVDRQS